jgi:hypothetical protein
MILEIPNVILKATLSLKPPSIDTLFSTAILIILHTYYSRFIPEGVAEASQIFLRTAHVLPKLFSYEYTFRREGL